MLGNMTRHSEFCSSRFRYEDLTLPYFCLQMGNNNILKSNNEICLKYEYQLKQKNETELSKMTYHFRLLAKTFL